MLAALSGTNDACGAIRLASVFSSNMVLQRDVPAKISGTADVGETVAVKLGLRLAHNSVSANPPAAPHERRFSNRRSSIDDPVLGGWKPPLLRSALCEPHLSRSNCGPSAELARIFHTRIGLRVCLTLGISVSLLLP